MRRPWSYTDCPAGGAVDVWDNAPWNAWQTAMKTVQDAATCAARLMQVRFPPCVDVPNVEL